MGGLHSLQLGFYFAADNTINHSNLHADSIIKGTLHNRFIFVFKNLRCLRTIAYRQPGIRSIGTSH
jgi:hypothetical protein